MPNNYFITGGAGFIGVNYAHHLLSKGERVRIYDNLSRTGAGVNIKWLQDEYGENSFQFVEGDVKDATLLGAAARDADIIVHLAGQVAVTTSVYQPRKDFEDNAVGTFNVLEAARLSENNPIVLYASTNKVYGGMKDLAVENGETRYRYAHLKEGISELHPLDFYSPYGCSKGAGDQYVRDYHRIYDLPTVVFRQSCIYGPRQFGLEDQGWVAWFIIAAVTNRPITIYGDGKQVRDVLYVDDLLKAYDAAIEKIEDAAGQIYNIGGGPNNLLSIWAEFGPMLEDLMGNKIAVSRDSWRPGDQLVYVSDIRKAKQELDWEPSINVKDGIRRLFNWVCENKQLFEI